MFGRTEKKIGKLTKQISELRNMIQEKQDIPQLNTQDQQKNNEISRWNSENITEEDKLIAAYALNLCTVSVSQIIDYDDLNILEQEYDAILNNLNLENIPKDEALLKILKQLLDTITFFRIQEGDKKFIEREYQQKMKNAIWSAVPNFGLIVAGGNPWTMAISLASQVGIGYMNYRKQKAQNTLEYEKQLWQLQRSAIEQFNALRRELFDTAWRLADKYNFKDSYRLTEKQISQFNEILMDTEVFRKYERLYAVKEYFQAYPPFWYYIGNAANAIAQEYFDKKSENKDRKKIFEKYRKLAIGYFEKFETFYETCEFTLLREDSIVASCCLEHIDLLELDKEKIKIQKLLDIAVKNAGTENDIKQLCAMDYLRIGDYENAKKYLRILVTENYNAITNAQILSQLYVTEAIEKNTLELKPDYLTLCRFVNSRYLYQWPERIPQTDSEKKELDIQFLNYQKFILLGKYQIAIKELYDKYSILLNRMFQNPDLEHDYPDVYFLDDEDNRQLRQQRLEDLFLKHTKNKKKIAYIENLKSYDIGAEYVDYLNDFIDAVNHFSCCKEVSYETVQQKISETEKDFIKLQRVLEEDTKNFNNENLKQIEKFTMLYFVEDYIKALFEKLSNFVNNLSDFSEISRSETEIRELCLAEKIKEPEVEVNDNRENAISQIKRDYVSSIAFEKAKEEKAFFEQQIKICKEHAQKTDSIVKEAKKVRFLVGEENNIDFNNYFKSDFDERLKDLKAKKKIIAVLEDTSSYRDADLIFTSQKVYKYPHPFTGKRKCEGEVFYKDILYNPEKECLEFLKNDMGLRTRIYENKYVNMNNLYDFIQELAKNKSQDNSVCGTNFVNNTYNEIIAGFVFFPMNPVMKIAIGAGKLVYDELKR